jgi:hypothetical protein
MTMAYPELFKITMTSKKLFHNKKLYPTLIKTFGFKHDAANVQPKMFLSLLMHLSMTTPFSII